MRLSPIHPTSQTDIYVSGNVIIHQKAVIAAGVVLQAGENSRILIGEGVCIGMGVVINAYQGTIELEAGAVLGAGVLLLGTGKIGKNACVGSASTIINGSIAQMTVVPSGSLMGDNSRQIAIAPEAEFSDISPSAQINGNSNPHVSPPSSPPEDPWESDPSLPEPPSVEVEVEVKPQIVKKEDKNAPVVGKVYINQLLVKLFPEREAFNRSQHNP